MSRRDRGRDRPVSPWWYVALFVGTAGLAGGITLLFHVMRSVMDIGGSCGAQYGVRCPDGVAGGTLLAIFGGIASLAIAGLAASRTKLPSIVLLAWPALFVALGVNFLQYGFDPPDGSGTSVGLVVCGVVFELMGVGPVLIGASVWRDRQRKVAEARAEGIARSRERSAAKRVRPRPAADHGEARTMLDSTWLPTSGPLPAGSARVLGDAAPVGGAPVDDAWVDDRRIDDGRVDDAPVDDAPVDVAPVDDGDDPRLVERLQQLADLHRRGDLTDAEFTAAKRALLSGDR